MALSYGYCSAIVSHRVSKYHRVGVESFIANLRSVYEMKKYFSK